MPDTPLIIHSQPKLDSPRLVLGLTGWMDGGEVSSGTVQCLVDKLSASRIAEIDPEDFYIFSFPGSMELSALFRPHVEIEEGLIKTYQEPQNKFYAAEKDNLLLFVGKEPHLHWHEYTACVFDVIRRFDVKQVYFIGSVAGLVPHTRDPRISSSVSDSALKDKLLKYNFRFSNYQGPCSIINHMSLTAAVEGIAMVTMVAEIPAYVHGRNPKCIEAVTRRLASLLGIDINLDDFRTVADELEKKLNEAIEERSELAEHIQKLEENYDKEVFDTEMGDLKNWLQQQGIRLD